MASDPPQSLSCLRPPIRKPEKDLALSGMVVGTPGVLLTLADDIDV